jgi:hypothetical protein
MWSCCATVLVPIEFEWSSPDPLNLNDRLRFHRMSPEEQAQSQAIKLETAASSISVQAVRPFLESTAKPPPALSEKGRRYK